MATWPNGYLYRYHKYVCLAVGRVRDRLTVCCGKAEYQNNLYVLQNVPFFILGWFVKLRKTTFTFVMPICPSVRPSARYNSTPTEGICMTFHI